MNAPSDNPIRLHLDERTSYRFSIILKRLLGCLAEMHTDRFGLSSNGWKVMSVIERFGPLSAIEAGSYVNLEPDKITRTVDVLVKQGLALRRQDKVDRRRIRLTLSAKGKRVHDEVEQVRYALEYEFLAVLTRAELKALYSILDKLEPRAAEIFTPNGSWQTIVRKHTANPVIVQRQDS